MTEIKITEYTSAGRSYVRADFEVVPGLFYAIVQDVNYAAWCVLEEKEQAARDIVRQQAQEIIDAADLLTRAGLRVVTGDS